MEHSTTTVRLFRFVLNEDEARELRDKLNVATGASYPALDDLRDALREFCDGANDV